MLKLIIADDERIIRETISTIIDWSQYGIELAGLCSNGIEAYNMILDESPDLVITDIRMPVMDGLESARRIRTSGRPDARRIPIIALTANAFDEDTRKSLASGMNGHLSKPIQVDQMLETLGKCMGLKK